MNDTQLDDLKQYFAATLSQTEARLTERIDNLENRFDGLENKFDGLEHKMDEGFAGVGEAFESSHAQQEELNKQVDTRLAKLERRTA